MERRLSEASVAAIIDALETLGSRVATPPNLRTVSRILDRAAHLEHKPMAM